ncbi:2Fe-2S iron-sulfur cluster-binding protein [Halobacillus naozhouensis]|uniref:2Fe-2S iron-sulfur cluster-binding protein n=1 Tax=Halobacillus naozhouensis TaxID=554880 RepID=A0ABY8J1Z6_9BACI|nr:2Fe-2S iron-sulfur cluster-binding protein [Halobacillus naozhouensis]WFT75597.1 2Fe-2S iron-sulfur cluster-binding protein [Halobacillus naozhouensis]
MPKVKLHVDGEIVEQEVKDHANLVVLAGIKQFPKLKYGCGMGKCTRCTCRVIDGGDQLDPPNWKEEKRLGDKLEEGYRLTCQLSVKDDLEISQENIDVRKKKREVQELRKD